MQDYFVTEDYTIDRVHNELRFYVYYWQGRVPWGEIHPPCITLIKCCTITDEAMAMTSKLSPDKAIMWFDIVDDVVARQLDGYVLEALQLKPDMLLSSPARGRMQQVRGVLGG